MSVAIKRSENPEDGYCTPYKGVESGEDCFFCGKTLSYPAIGWVGFGKDIVMHSECTQKLCTRLTLDMYAVSVGREGGMTHPVK